ncbi:MAG TPA: GNAT family N-acetyltransferase [Tepidisphaeraceae bacterium]|jgi:CelD/BcsL family acetyltransferase involved in cellulose biosynthesis
MADQVLDLQANRFVTWRRALAYSGYAFDQIAPYLPRFNVFRSSFKQVTIDALTVRCHRSIPDEEAFIAAWEQLYRQCPDATPYHSLAWQKSLLETAEAAGRLRLFTVHDRERLVGILPLEARWGRVLRSTGGILANYLDPLIDPQYATKCWRAVLLGMKRLTPGRSIVIEGVREESASCRELRDDEARAAGFELCTESGGTVARVPLPATWDAYLAALDGHDRRELKRKLRKAEQAGGRLDVCSDPVTVEQQINSMLHLLGLGGGGRSLKAKWLFPKHFANCSQELARSGRLAIFTLVIQEQPAARAIQLPASTGLIGWNITFEPAMRDWSPGIVLLAMIIRHSIEKGYTVHDMSSGQYEYKYRLGAKDYPLRKLTLKPAA